MMKNFVKLLVIAATPVLLTSVVYAAEGATPKPAPKEKTLAELREELNYKMPDYYADMFAAYLEAIYNAKQIENVYKLASEKQTMTTPQFNALFDATNFLLGEKMSWFTSEWLPLTRKTEATLKSNVKTIWDKISSMELRDKTDPKKKVVISYTTTSWGDREIIAPFKKNNKKDATTYGDIPALRSAIGGTLIKLDEAAKTLKIKEIKTPLELLTLYTKLAKVDFVSPIRDLAKAAAMKDLAKNAAFEELYEDIIIPMKAKIAELEKTEGKEVKTFASALKRIA